MTNIKQTIEYFTIIREKPNLSQRQLANNSGISLGKVNYCLKNLIEKGCIKVENFKNNTNKLQYAYLLTPKGIIEKASLTQQFLQLKIEEYNTLELEIKTLQEATV